MKGKGKSKGKAPLKRMCRLPIGMSFLITLQMLRAALEIIESFDGDTQDFVSEVSNGNFCPVVDKRMRFRMA